MNTEIQQAAVPEFVYLGLDGNSWRAQLRVSEGDHVHKGSLLVAGDHAVHASTSGTVLGIVHRPSSHRLAAPRAHIAIQADRLDHWNEESPTKDPLEQSPAQLIEAIRAAGIAGLGGGAYPTANKLAIACKKPVRHFVINAIECEPGISADKALMLAEPVGILKAALVVLKTLNIERCTLAISDDKQEVTKKLGKTIDNLGLSQQINLTVVPAGFPNGSERQLVSIVLNLSLPRNTYPAQLGIVCLNVSTLYAIYQATYQNKALVERVITLTTHKDIQNVRVHLGTPAHTLFAGPQNDDEQTPILRGGALTGWLQSPVAVVEKGTTGLTHTVFRKAHKTVACIRCAKCSDICPENLLPQELLWYSQPTNVDKLKSLELSACLECGLCESVCPSFIPLTNIFRDSKDSLHHIAVTKAHAENANIRVTARQQRISKKGVKVQSMREKRLKRIGQINAHHSEPTS